ncbi:MAG: hypothetical protein RL338_1903, partial [Chloroflexota bacterium]
MVPVSFGVRRGGAGRLALVQRRSVVLLLIASLLAGLGAVAPAGSRTALGNGAGPRTWYVGPGDGLGGGFPSCTFPDFTTGGGFDSSSGSIQRAVDAAATGDTIHLCDHTYELTAGIDLATSSATALTFEGETTAGTIVDGLDAVRLFDATGKDVTFVGLTLEDGRTESSGGAVNADDVTIRGAVFHSNSAGGYGGAIEASGRVEVTDGTFIANAGETGAGALSVAGAVTAVDSVFEDNTAGSYAGAVYAASIAIVGGRFTRNVATLRDGGAIFANEGAVTI